jgi:hypothetical protein
MSFIIFVYERHYYHACHHAQPSRAAAASHTPRHFTPHAIVITRRRLQGIIRSPHCRHAATPPPPLIIIVSFHYSRLLLFVISAAVTDTAAIRRHTHTTPPRRHGHCRHCRISLLTDAAADSLRFHYAMFQY